MAREIALSGERGRGLFALVDVEDYEHVARWSWSLGAQGYPCARRGPVTLHRFIMGQPWIDHIDRDKLNNQRSNLRVATNAQNAQNRPATVGTSRYRGVCWDQQLQKWRARGKLDRVSHHIGLYDDEETAGLAAGEWRRLHMPYSQEASVATSL